MSDDKDRDYIALTSVIGGVIATFIWLLGVIIIVGSVLKSCTP